MSEKIILITGFDPFGGESVNPSFEAVKALPDIIGEWKIVKLLIPTVYDKAPELALKKAREISADAVLCIGQAGGRAAVTPEVIGINLREASIPDNEGRLCSGEPIRKGGEAAFFSTLPVRDMVAAIKKEGINASLSYSAGAFVCNDTLYSLLAAFDGTDVRVGFIHIPFIPEQTRDKDGVPSLPLCDSIRALTAAIRAI